MEFYVPLPTPFYCIFINKFSKIFKMWSFMSGNFFRKISQKFPEIFSTFSKSKKTIIFAPKTVQNHNINQNLAKFSLKIPKIVDFSLKTLNFSKFSAPSAPKMWSFRSLRDSILWSWGPPP